MDRLLAAWLAAAMTAPPDATAAPVPTQAPAEEAADATAPDDAPDDAPAPTEPDPMGLPSVEDAPEQAPQPYTPPPPPAPAPAAARPEGPAPAPAPPPVGKDRLGCDFSKSCRQLTITGTVLGALGLAAVGAGVALYVREDEVRADEPAYATSTKPPGLIALTLGAGVVVTSVLMLVASHRGAKEKDASAWHPLLRGRF